MLVISDDVSLPFGTLRLRHKGSAGGHNGLSDVISELGTNEFSRLKIGIGAPPAGTRLYDHVLGEFTEEESEKLPGVFEKAAKIIDEWVIEKSKVIDAADKDNGEKDQQSPIERR